MTVSIRDLTDIPSGCGDLPAPARVPDPQPVHRPPTAWPSPTDPAWLDAATIRQIADLTAPTRDDLLFMYGTANPDELRRIPFVLAEDIAAAERYTAEQAAA